MKHLYSGILILAMANVCQSVNAEWSGVIEFSHTSAVLVRESGYGLNSVFLDAKYTRKGVYMAVGIGLHDESSDCPEVCFGDDSLARFRVGYEFDL